VFREFVLHEGVTGENGCPQGQDTTVLKKGGYKATTHTWRHKFYWGLTEAKEHKEKMVVVLDSQR
jgi:hypothetical protein